MANALIRVAGNEVRVPVVPDSFLFTLPSGQPELLPAAEVETWDFGQATPWWYDIETVLRVTEEASNVETVVEDRTNLVATPTHVATDYQFTVTDIFDPIGLTVDFTSSNPSVATVDESGLVQWVANGSVNVTLSDGTTNVVVPVTVARYPTTSTVSKFKRFNAGTLGRHICDSTDALLVGANPATDKAVFSVLNHASGGTYVRNPDCWLAGVDLTAIPVWNSVSGAGGNGVAISPRHVLFAAHNVPAATGGTIRFVTNTGEVVTRTMIARAYHPQAYISGVLRNDFAVVLLDSALPASITPAKVFPKLSVSGPKITLPTGDTTVDAAARVGFFFPQVWVDFEEKALVGGDGAWEQGYSATFGDFPQREAFAEYSVGGDSGSPVFAIINGELAVLGVMTYAGFGVSMLYQNGQTASGLGATPRLDAIDTVMTTLGGGYTTTPISIAAFPNK